MHSQHAEQSDRFRLCHHCNGQIGRGDTMTVWMFPDGSHSYIHSTCIDSFKTEIVRLTLRGIL